MKADRIQNQIDWNTFNQADTAKLIRQLEEERNRTSIDDTVELYWIDKRFENLYLAFANEQARHDRFIARLEKIREVTV